MIESRRISGGIFFTQNQFVKFTFVSRLNLKFII